MFNNVPQLLICTIIVTIFVFLWRARHQPFAGFGNSWTYMLAGFAALSAGEIFNLAFIYLAQKGTIPADAIDPILSIGHATIVFGLLFTAFGVHRWLSAVYELTSESVTVKKRNFDLTQRVSRDEMLLSTVPAALYRARAQSSIEVAEVIFENDRIEELLGFGVEDFEADPKLFTMLMHADDQRKFAIERDELWHQDSIVVEHRFRHKNGEYRWLRRHLNRVSGDSTDPTEWHGCAFDITDLKEAQARLTNFLGAAPDPVVTTDERGKIVLVNAQAERMFGYSKKELLGRDIHTLIPAGQFDQETNEFSNYLQEKTSRTIGIRAEINGQRKGGVEFPIEVSLSPIESGCEKLWAFATRDVSYRKSVEAQLRQAQKMEAIGQLTGGIAHDFNNMLTVIIGNLQLLERATKKNEMRSHTCQAALDASMRAAELVKRLLAFSRRQILQPKSMPINDLVKGIEPLLHRTISENISLKTHLANDLWLACVDPSQLENTLVNLAINARDALESGGKLTIETTNTTLDKEYAAKHNDVIPGDYVLIAVSDNGHGISKENLPHVFEPFYSTKQVGKGSGLGLSMVYGFVKQSNGHIKIYSEEGHGTTIKIYIPRSIGNCEKQVDQSTCNEAVQGGSETVLIVEDNDDVRRVVSSQLTSLGYRTLHANSGSEALKIIAEYDDIKLLFTDIVMPGGINGVELARRACEKRPDLGVLYTSGYTETAVIENGLLKQGCKVLNKPYLKKELARSVRDTLDREKHHESDKKPPVDRRRRTGHSNVSERGRTRSWV